MEFKENNQSLEKKQQLAGKSTFCPSCSFGIDGDDIFCPECGAKVIQESIPCHVCGTENSSQEYCSDCGANLIPHFCTSCNTKSFGDFCESCGTPVSELGHSFLENTKTLVQPQSMSSAEADSILQSLQTRLSPETKRMQEKLRQRIILQREREFSKEREERIQNYKSKGLPKIQTIQTDEIRKIREQMKVFSGYLQRKKEEKEAEERKIEEARRAEEKRIWRMNRVNGLWVSTVARTSATLDLTNASATLSGKLYLFDLHYESIDVVQVTWNGNSIEFHSVKTHIKWISPNVQRVYAHFTGRVSEDGESMTGYMCSAENWQEVFIKS